MLAALSAIFFAMYTRSILPSGHGNFYELYAIAAAVLGGFSLRGGEGSIVGVVLGTILLQVLQNLVNLLGIPSSLNFAVMGSVILIGVIADQQFARYRKRRELARGRIAAGSAAPYGRPKRRSRPRRRLLDVGLVPVRRAMRRCAAAGRRASRRRLSFANQPRHLGDGRRAAPASRSASGWSRSRGRRRSPSKAGSTTASTARR